VGRKLSAVLSGIALSIMAIGAGVVVAVVPLGSGIAGAASEIIVNDANDSASTPANCVPGAETDCTLRSGLAEAATLSGAVTVDLPDPTTVANHPGPVYVVDNGPTENGLLTMSAANGASSVALSGAGASTTAIQGQCTGGTCVGLVQVNGPGTTSISGVTVEDGVMYGDSGGGIWNNGGTLTVSNSTITANFSDNSGGGIFNEGILTLQNDTVTDNSTSGSAAGVDSTGTLTMSGTTISDNTASAGANAGGIEIDSGTNSLTGDTIEGNTATEANGGGVYVDGGTNTFTGVTIEDNTATWTSEEGGGSGGGVFTSGGTNTFTGGTVSGNQAYLGAGVFIADGTTTITQLTVAGNTASEAGGGVVVNDATTTITTTITDSTISGNTADGTVGISYELGDGGGILDSLCNTLVLTNDTIVNNVAGGHGRGGGYEGEGCDTPGVNTAFLFDTVAGNTAGDSSGGGNIQLSDSSSVTLGETIVAGGVVDATPGTNCAIDNGASATFTSKGYNLIDDSTCGTPAGTDVIGQGAELGPLQNNGGPTNTELPAATSPAVGKIPAATCSATGVATDQRGQPRGTGLNGACTIGAVEVVQASQTNPNGYRLVANEGGIFDFGLNFNGSLANTKLNAPIVGLANSPGPNGYLLVGRDGGVFAKGGANFYGSLGNQVIPSPIAAIAAPPSETGYWLVAQSGKIYPFGSVPSLPAVQLPPGAHIVGMASTTDGQGAWLTDQFGDVYAEGSALYEGGLGGVHINAPIVGIAAAAAGQGYVLAGADGGVFRYGTQGFFGSVPGVLKAGQHIAAPIVGIAVTHSGNGYWEVGADGGVYAFGDAPFLGSTYTTVPGDKLNGPIVGIQHLGAATSAA
jgi:hypothetical protein